MLRLVHIRSDGGWSVHRRYGRKPPMNWVPPNVSEIRIDSLVVESIDDESPEGQLLMEYQTNHSTSSRRTALAYHEACTAR